MATFPPFETETLRTILKMESQKGYTDVVVVGGLDRYLSNWSQQIRIYIKSPQLLSRFDDLQLSKSNYSVWDIQKRKSWTGDLLIWLEEFEKQTGTESEKRTIAKRIKATGTRRETISSSESRA